MASEKITAIIDSVKELSVLELKELIDAYCEEFGVSAVAAAAPAAAGAAAPAAEEKTEFDVVLAEVAPRRSRSSRLSVRSPVWAWPRPRLPLRLPPRPSRRASPRTRPRS